MYSIIEDKNKITITRQRPSLILLTLFVIFLFLFNIGLLFFGLQSEKFTYEPIIGPAMFGILLLI